MARRFFSFRFEFDEFVIDFFDLLLQLRFLINEECHLFRVYRFFNICRPPLGAQPGLFTIGASHQAIKLAVNRVNDPNRVSDLFRAVVRQPVQAEVLPGIAKEVFLRPSGEHPTCQRGRCGLVIRCNYGGLMAAFAQFANFAHP